MLEPVAVPPHLKFSPSRLDSEDSCPQKAYYMYSRDLDPGEDRPGNALLLGLIIHKFLELWHGEGIHPQDAFLTVRELFPSYEAQILLSVALVYMLRYVKVYHSENFYVVATELRYTVPFTTPHGHQVYLDGIIDMLTEKEAGSGKVSAWDNKTDSRNMWTSDVILFNRQTNFYSVLLSLIGYEVTELTINQIKTAIKKPEKIHTAPREDLFARYSVGVTPTTINAWKLAIGKRIDQILEAEYVHKTLGSHCIYCPFRQACQMELKGVDPEPYLRNNFGKRSERGSGGGDLSITIDIEDGVF